MGTVVIAVIAVVGLIAQTNRTTTIDPAVQSGTTATTVGLSEPVETTTSAATNASEMAAYEECMSTLTVTVTLPCGEYPGAEIQATHSTEFESVPTTEGPAESEDDGTGPSDQTTLTIGPGAPPPTPTIDIEGCYQVTTIPDCAELVGSIETYPTTVLEPGETGQECIFVTPSFGGPSTTFHNRPECHTTTTGPGPGATTDLCDPNAVTTTTQGCPETTTTTGPFSTTTVVPCDPNIAPTTHPYCTTIGG